MRRILTITLLMVAFLMTAGLASAQVLTANPATVTMAGMFAGPAVSTTINLTSNQTGGSYLIVQNPVTTWLKISPATGALPQTVTLTADPTGLANNTYGTTLTVYGGTNPITVPVSFAVSNLGVSPSTLSFAYQIGSTIPVAQGVAVSSTVTTPFIVSASTTTGGNWLQVAPANGQAPATISAILNPAVVPSMAAGTYTGSIVITPIGTGTAVTVPVTLTVAAAAAVTIAPASISFGYQTGGSNNVTSQTVQFSTNSTVAINFGLTVSVDPNPAGLNWLTATPSSGVIPAGGTLPVTLTVVPGTLPSGTYNARVLLFAPGASPMNQTIPVTLTISSSPVLNVPTATLAFTYQIGTAAPAPQTVTPTSTGAAITYSISTSTTSGGNWLSAPATQTTPAGFAVSVTPAGLAVGTYTGTVTVTAVGYPQQQIPVTLKVSNDPVIVPSVNSFTFLYQTGQTAPAAQSLRVLSSTGAQLNYTVTTAQTWLVLGGQTTGLTDGSVTVQANPAGQAVGTYNGTITITATVPSTGAAAVNSPVSLPVTMYVSDKPMLVTSSPSMTFTAQVGGGSPQAIPLTLTSTSATDQITYTVASSTDTGGNWLLVGPVTGSTPSQILATVVPSLLSTGTYTGSIKITATGPGGAAVLNSPVTIPVVLVMTQGTLSVAPATLQAFTQTMGGPAPAAQTLQVTTNGSTPASYSVAVSNGGVSVPWLKVSPTGGTTPGTVSVSVDSTNLSAGTYQGSVTISAPGVAGSPVTISVSFTLAPAAISATPASLTFNAVQGAAVPAAQTLNVAGTGNAVLNFSVTTATTSGGSWLTATTATGTTPGTVTVSVNQVNLGPGTYQGTVTITSVGATGSPVTVPVTLTVTASQTLTVSQNTLKYNYITGLTVPPAQTVLVTSSGGTAPVTVTSQLATGTNWLTVTPVSGNTPLQLSVSVAPQALAAGVYAATITVSSAVATTPQVITVTLTVQAVAPPTLIGLRNSASGALGSVAPGENVLVFGTNMGTTSDPVYGKLTSGGTLETMVNSVRVLFDGIPAPIYYVTPTQSSVFVPYEIQGRQSTTVRVEYQGVQSDPVTYTIAGAVPGVYTQNFSGTGPGAILNQDYSVNGSQRPATKGTVVMVYGTGEGATDPVGVTGSITPNNGTGLKTPVAAQTPVTATIGGRPAQVVYAGSAPGSPAGVFQVNVVVPADAPTGVDEIVITFGSFATQSKVTVAVQ